MCKRAVISRQRSKVPAGRSLADLHPDLAAEWSERNARTASQVAAHGRIRGWWRCTAGHEWQTTVHNRTRSESGTGCPTCAAAKHSAHMARVTSSDRSLVASFPAVAAEWDWKAPCNEGDSPRTVMGRSGKQRGWICAECGHRWVAIVVNRTKNGAGCPPCSTRGSTQEEAVRSAVTEIWPSATSGTVPRTDGRSRRPWEVDVLVAEMRLVVEFDGSYWHDDTKHPGALARDRAKTKDLISQGWRVIRIREAPLAPIDSEDLVVTHAISPNDLALATAHHLNQVLPATASRRGEELDHSSNQSVIMSM